MIRTVVAGGHNVVTWHGSSQQGALSVVFGDGGVVMRKQLMVVRWWCSRSGWQAVGRQALGDVPFGGAGPR